MFLFSALQLLAQANTDGAANSQPGGGLLGMFAPILMVMVLFYFLVLRPGRRQEDERRTMLSALKKGDTVVTQGGLIDVVATIKDKGDEVILKVDEGSNT